jgi:hypothetical protein
LNKDEASSNADLISPDLYEARMRGYSISSNFSLTRKKENLVPIL